MNWTNAIGNQKWIDLSIAGNDNFSSTYVRQKEYVRTLIGKNRSRLKYVVEEI